MGIVSQVCASAAFAASVESADIPPGFGQQCIQHGDTVSEMVLDRTGMDMYLSQQRLDVIKQANPHIDDLDQVSPGQSIVLPESPEGLSCAVANLPDATQTQQTICALDAVLG